MKCRNCNHEVVKSHYDCEGLIHKKEKPKYIGGLSVCQKRVRLGLFCNCSIPELMKAKK